MPYRWFEYADHLYIRLSRPVRICQQPLRSIALWPRRKAKFPALAKWLQRFGICDPHSSQRVQRCPYRISQLLADRFLQAGFLVSCGTAMATGWYRKGEATASATQIELLALPAYHELIKVTVAADEFGSLRAVLRNVAARVPRLAGAFRRFHPAPLPMDAAGGAAKRCGPKQACPSGRTVLPPTSRCTGGKLGLL